MSRRVSLGAQIGARQAHSNGSASLRLAASRRITRDGALDVALSDTSAGDPSAMVAVRFGF